MRTKVSEGLTLASGAKTAVAETRLSTGGFPAAGNSNYGLASETSIRGNNVSQVEVTANGVINITYSNDAAIQDDIVLLTPSIGNGGSLTWVCSSTTVEDRYLPANCR
ncbi:MAG: pilin [Cellvibrionaceae bacterium]|nr:pilin [Cellvibrionaceae bacterium]